jgi:4-oxalocrotonate tautomerase
MPVVRVSMLEGRTKEQKAALAKAITNALVDIAKTKPESVFVIFENVRKEDWAAAGNLMG